MGGGGRQRSGGRDRGSDLRYNLEITLEEAFHARQPASRCQPPFMRPCNGSGAKPGSKPKTCATCGGAGRRACAAGLFRDRADCHVCQGRGQTIDDPCPTCKGAGRVTKERQLSVNIPAGVEDGTRIRLAGEGEGGLRGAPRAISHLPQRETARLSSRGWRGPFYCRVPISMVQASLGGEFSLRGLDGMKFA